MRSVNFLRLCTNTKNMKDAYNRNIPQYDRYEKNDMLDNHVRIHAEVFLKKKVRIKIKGTCQSN